MTGALVSTAAHFAQILEGQAAAIEELMDSIHRDVRHDQVTVLRVASITQRRFPDWSMAYSGHSTYLARHISPLVSADIAKDDVRIDRLIGFMAGLAADGE